MFNTARLEISDIFGINNNEALIFQVLTFLSPLREQFKFLNPLGFEAKSDLNRKPPK